MWNWENITIVEQNNLEEQLVISPLVTEWINDSKTKSESALENKEVDNWSMTEEEQAMLPEWYENLLEKYNWELRAGKISVVADRVMCKQAYEWFWLLRPTNHLEEWVWEDVYSPRAKWRPWFPKTNYSKKMLESLDSSAAVSEGLSEGASFDERLAHYEKKLKYYEQEKQARVDLYKKKFDIELLSATLSELRTLNQKLLEDFLKFQVALKETDLWSDIITVKKDIRQVIDQESEFVLIHDFRDFYLEPIKQLTSKNWLILMSDLNRAASDFVWDVISKEIEHWENIKYSLEYFSVLKKVIDLNFEMVDFLEKYYIDFNWYFEVKVEMLQKQLKGDFSVDKDYEINRKKGIVSVYLTESLGNKEKTIDSFLRQKQWYNHEDVNTIFINIHTLKWWAWYIGYTTIANLAYKIEELFSLARDRKQNIDSEDVWEAMILLYDILEYLQYIHSQPDLEYDDNDEIDTVYWNEVGDSIVALDRLIEELSR